MLFRSLKNKNYKLWLVGIDKDISHYGHFQNANWINSEKIYNGENFEHFDIEKFFQMVANCHLGITVATSFEQICGMMDCNTITIYRYDRRNMPIIKNDDYNNFFSNPNWYRHITKMRYEELFHHLNHLLWDLW